MVEKLRYWGIFGLLLNYILKVFDCLFHKLLNNEYNEDGFHMKYLRLILHDLTNKKK